MNEQPLYTPNADEEEMLQSYSWGIIASSPWVRGRCELPHRIVLRRFERTAQYVVHTQVIETHANSVLRTYFEQGSYFDHSLSESFLRAWREFVIRSGLCLGVEERRPQKESADAK